MFQRDQRAIQGWCKNPDRLVDVGTMVLLSIRMQWVGVGNQLAKVRAGDDTPLWGWKANGVAYLRHQKRRLYGKVRDCRAGRIDEADLMKAFLRVPGLGMAKAGFLVQLTTGKAGCLDMHNVKQYGLSPADWKPKVFVTVSRTLRDLDAKVDFYLALCAKLGGSEVLWDNWCNYLATKVSTLKDGDDVSRRHYTYLKEV